MPTRPLRLTTVMAVARALLATVPPREAVEVMVAEFGWDPTFQACVLLTGEPAREAFGHAWAHLVTEPLQHELSPVDGLRADS